jgi:hypothetical protein
MQLRVLLAAVAVVGAISACDRDEIDATGPAQVMYTASLTGAGERPAVTTNGVGSMTGTLTSGNVLFYTISWSGLGSASNAGHFHGPSTSTTTAAGVAIDLAAPTAGRTMTNSNASGGAGSATGQINFNNSWVLANGTTISGDSLKKLFDNEGLYINIHTTVNTGGEIAGIVKKLQ